VNTINDNMYKQFVTKPRSTFCKSSSTFMLELFSP
jgi:hypothetical protein